MSAIVKANASLTAGGLAVLRREYSTTDDGTLNYKADYCCLSQFANNHIGKFRTGATPPTAIPASMSQLQIDGTPKLYDLATNTQNGLTYFNASYSAAILGAAEVITTQSEEIRNFSGTFDGESASRNSSGAVAQIFYGQFQMSFDYISTTITVEAKSRRSIPEAKGRVGNPFNISVGLINGEAPQLIGKTYAKETTQDTFSVTKSSRGSYVYRKSSSGIYQPNNDNRRSLQIASANTLYEDQATYWGAAAVS